MRRFGKYLIYSMVLVMLAGSIAHARLVAVNVGDVLPADLMVDQMEGEPIALIEVVKGKDTAIVFFNTSCNKCLDEIKWLNDEYAMENVVLVSIDLLGKVAVERWKQRYLKGMKNVRIFLDPEFVVAPRLGLGVTPSTVLVDKEGIVVSALIGYSEQAKKDISSFIK